MIKRAVYYIGNPENTVKLRRFFYITLILIVLLDVGVHLFHIEHTGDMSHNEQAAESLHNNGHAVGEGFIGEEIWGFWSVYGLIGCIIMIFVCKGIGHAWLMKKENYYE